VQWSVDSSSTWEPLSSFIVEVGEVRFLQDDLSSYLWNHRLYDILEEVQHMLASPQRSV
jgi:hypothetical protein